MRSLVRYLLIVLPSFILGSAPAWAQLPLPGLEDAPDFNLASTDALFDGARTLAQSIERDLEDRRAALEGEDPAPISESDRELWSRLRSLREEEVAILEDAAELARQAAREAKAPVESAEAASVEDLVERRLLVRRRRAQAEARANLAERLDGITALEAPDPGPEASRSDQIDHQTWRVQLAQARRARARALRAAAQARRAERAFERARGSLEVGPDDVDAAAAQLNELEEAAKSRRRELEEAKDALRRSIADRGPKSDEDVETWASARRIAHELALARYDLILQREENLKARRLRAEARLRVTRTLAMGAPISLSEELSRTQIQTSLAKVEEQWSSTQLHLVEARQKDPDDGLGRAARRAWEQRRETLEDTLDVLQDTREQLEAIQIMRTLGDEGDSIWRPALDFPVAVTLTVLALVVVLVLLRVGGRWIEARVGAREGRPHPGPKMSESTRRRAATVFLIVWPFLVVVGAAAGLLYGLWGLRLSPHEALDWIDRPIFYIDESPFSALSVVKLVVTLWVSFVLARALRVFLNQRLFAQLGIDRGLSNALATFVYYLALMVGAVVGLNVVGIGFSSLAVLLGVLGLGIGFGLRNITENFISGLIILAERPIQLGDFIDIDGRVEGQVRSIRARSTTVTTRDNISIIIPNSEFVGKQVTNWSHGDPKVRLNIPVGVVYGSDTDLVRRTLLEVAGRHGKVLKKPPPEVHFRAFGGSSLDFLLLVWIEEQHHRFRISSDLHFAIDKAFRKAGIVIAFPQLDLHLASISEKVHSALLSSSVPSTGPSRAEELAQARRERRLRPPSSLGASGPNPPAAGDVASRDEK